MQDLERMQPIICRVEHRDQVRRALASQQRRGLLPERIDVKWTQLSGGRLMAQVLPTEAPVPIRKAQPTVAGEIGKALMFVGAIIAGLALVVGVLVSLLAMADINWSAVAGLIVVAVIVMLMANRSNHRGACPGLHCAGCKHG